MYAAFTEDQRELRRNVRESLAQLCPPGVVRAAWTDRDVVRNLWQGLVDLGLLGVMVRADSGGLGLDARDAISLAEECGYAGLPGPFLETAWVAAPLLDTGEHAPMEVLRSVLTGTTRIAVQTPASALVADADVADAILVMGETSAELHSATSVELSAEAGVDGGRPLFRVLGVGAADIEFSDSVAAFERGALASAAFQLGLGRRMLDLALGYAKVREQFSRPIGSYQAVQHLLANASLALTFAAPLVWRAAHTVALGQPMAGAHVSMAHLRASAAAQVAGRAALQVHGAIGYTTEHDLHLFLKRSWAMQRVWGDETFHRRRIVVALDRFADPKEYWDV